MQNGVELTFDEQKAACIDLCSQVVSEIKTDVFNVTTKTITKIEGFATKATVRRRKRLVFIGTSDFASFAGRNNDEWNYGR
jgi:hypothetical protein